MAGQLIDHQIIRALLYRAIRELNFIHETEGIPPRVSCLITTAEGKSIVKQGMFALGVPDLEAEFLVPEQLEFSDQAEDIIIP